MPKFTSQDALNFLRGQRDPKLVEARVQKAASDKNVRKIIPQNSNPDVANPGGAIMRLYSDYVLTSSGNTVTLTPSDGKLISMYTDSVTGWIPKTIEAAITLSTAGYSSVMYDVFLYFDYLDAPNLYTVAWASETARTTALDTVDGKKLLSTDYTYLYLTTGRYNGSTLLLPSQNPSGELFYGTGDPRNNVSDPATGVGMYAAGVSLGGVVYNFFTVLNGVVGWGTDLVGSIRAIAGGFTLNATGMSLAVGGLTVFNITAAFAKFGSDTSAANTTAFAIFFTAQTYNGESMEAGSVLFGSNSATYANVLWRPSTKQLQFRAATTVQAYINTDGTITAASGNLTLGTSGIKLIGDVWPSTARFIMAAADNTALVLGQIIGTYGGAAVNSGMVIYGRAHDSGVRGFVYLGAQDDTGTNKATLVIDTNGTAIFDFTAVVGAVGSQSLTLSTKTSGTNALNTVLYLQTDSSGSAAAGLGSAIAFQTKDSGGNMQSIGYAAVPLVDPTNGSEISKFMVGMYRKGVSFALPVSGNIFNNTTNTGNVTTGETDIFTSTLIAGLFAEQGDRVIMDAVGTTVAHATATRRIRVYFGGTVIYDSTALVTATAAKWVIRAVCVRSSSSAVKCSVTFTAVNFAGAVCDYTAVTGLTLTNTQILKITGQAGAAGAATNDIVGTFCEMDFRPSA
jgi:hypothetical protein